MELQMLQEELRSCRKCVDAGFIAEARPLTAGHKDAPFMVIGQAPSRTDHQEGKFYSGPAGRKLREWLREAGFAEGDFGTTIYAAAITRCFPGRVPGSSRDRVPSREEQALCRTWLEQELAVVQPRALILFGGLAISAFLSRAPLTELIGRTFSRENRVLIPLPHSSGASTWLNSPENRTRLAEAIQQLRETRLSVLYQQGEKQDGGISPSLYRGPLSGPGEWINQAGKSGEFESEFLFVFDAEGAVTQHNRRRFLQPDGSLLYEELSEVRFTLAMEGFIEVALTAEGREHRGAGYLLGNYLHFEAQVSASNHLENTCIFSENGLTLLGSATNTGNFTAWKETLTRDN